MPLPFDLHLMQLYLIAVIVLIVLPIGTAAIRANSNKFFIHFT